MWFVYILKSKIKDRYYIGCSNNLERRLREHNKGDTLSIKAFIPYEIIYKETYANQVDAYIREKDIKEEMPLKN